MGLKQITLLALAGLAAAKDLPRIHIKGQKFFYENGTQFFMRGVAYQQDPASSSTKTKGNVDYVDPLADEDICKQDVPLLKELRTNTIRTYAIDPKKDHSACMKLLNDAGIYVVADLSQPKLSINRNEPKWNWEIFQRYKDVVDEFAQYTNIIGFFAGNEVTNSPNNTQASAYVKAALRDTKKYIKDQGYELGVGYATDDHPDFRDDIAHYFNCGQDSQATDFWGYNIYSFCGKSTIEKAQWDKRAEFFKDYNVPSFFAEYGCNEGPQKNEGRTYDDTVALYSKQMTDVFSGGIVYMYHEEENQYGLVDTSGGKPKKMKNFDVLKKQIAKTDPEPVEEDDYNFSGERSKCPEVRSEWRAHSTLPPTPDKALCDCMVAEAACGVADGVDEEDFGEVFGFICGEHPKLCAGMNSNATTGVHGAYSMCTPKQKLTYVLSKYYEDQDQADDSCDFGGVAETKTPSSQSSCEAGLKKAEEHNEKAATATAGSPEATGDSDDNDSFGIPSAPMANLFSVGSFAVGAYMVAALGAGAAAIAL